MNFAADEDLRGYCAAKYHNFQIHKGYFDDTITNAFLDYSEIESANTRLGRLRLLQFGKDGDGATDAASAEWLRRVLR